MINNYNSSIKEMQTQLFNVLAIAACVANLFGSILNAVLHGNALPTQICVICGIIILAFCLFGFSSKYKGLASVGILITVVWIEFPFLYSAYENIILIYFILSVAGIAIYFPRQFSIPFCIFTIVWDILVIVLLHFFPLYTIPINETSLLFFTICSYLIVAIAIFVLVYSLIMRYEHQKEELFTLTSKFEFAARFGGEEFMIIFDHADKDHALQVLNNLSHKLETYFMNELNTSITFSGGLELYSNRKKIDELIMNADNKLYQAKRNGKNQIVC